MCPFCTLPLSDLESLFKQVLGDVKPRQKKVQHQVRPFIVT